MFPRRCNGSSLHATTVLPKGSVNASTALATFVEPPSHGCDGPSSPLPNRNVTSPVAHHKSCVSNSCRTSNAGAGIGEKRSSVAWRTGRESESILGDNAGMAAAVLSPGGVSLNIYKKKVVDVNHFHVSLAHAHLSVLKATTLQHGMQFVGELAPRSGCSIAKGTRSPTSHHTTSRAAAPIDMVHIDTAGPFQE